MSDMDEIQEQFYYVNELTTNLMARFTVSTMRGCGRLMVVQFCASMTDRIPRMRASANIRKGWELKTISV